MSHRTPKPPVQVQTREERLYEHAHIIRHSYLRDRCGQPHTHQDWLDYLDTLLAFLKAQTEPEGAA